MSNKKLNNRLDERGYYSESFKKYVVRQVEIGVLTKEQAKYKYKIGGNSAVLNWCRKYGKSTFYVRTRFNMTKDKTADVAYKKRIKELESALSASKLRSTYLECVLEAIEEEYGVTLGKKLPELQSPSVNKKIRSSK